MVVVVAVAAAVVVVGRGYRLDTVGLRKVLQDKRSLKHIYMGISPK